MTPPASGGVGVRPGRAADLPELVAIYNHYVRSSPVTFDLEPVTVKSRRAWFATFAERGRHRLFVAEAAGAVRGYACSHPFRPKGAYATSVETSVYVTPDATGRGLGAALYAALLGALASEDVHRAYAGVTLPNPTSVALHRRFGFEPIGTFHEAGHKLGRYWSVQWFEKRLRSA